MAKSKTRFCGALRHSDADVNKRKNIEYHERIKLSANYREKQQVELTNSVGLTIIEPFMMYSKIQNTSV